MGYDDERFEAPIPANMRCAVCKEVFLEPKELECGHQLCLSCLQQMSVKSQVICPEDRDLSDGYSEPNIFFRKLYFDLRVKCQWHRFGCSEVRVIGSESGHEEKCAFSGHIHRPCPRECGYSGPLQLPDGSDHSCVSFLHLVLQKMRDDAKGLRRRIRHLEHDLIEARLDKQDMAVVNKLLVQQRHDLIFGSKV